MRSTERFPRLSGQLLVRRGYVPDQGRVERTGSGCIVLYHYTHPEHLDAIRATGGLRARLPVPGTAPPPALEGGYLLETLLEPFPLWLSCSPYFGDLALRMMREYVGDLLLRLELPPDFPGLYVADYGHVLECKHEARYGSPALGLGYNCSNGQECAEAEARSYVALSEYDGGHIAPVAKVIRRGQCIVVPARYIEVAQAQPLR